MNLVVPICDRSMVREVERQAELMGPQPHMVVLLGLYTGLRISDILRLRVADIRMDRIVMREKKTGKRTEIEMNPAARTLILQYTSRMRDEQLIFESRHIMHAREPINYMTAYRWIKEACRRAGFRGEVGCHSLRKTHGYFMYQQTKDVALLQEHFNHSSPDITLRYIGVKQNDINQVTKSLHF